MILNYYEKGNKENPSIVFIHGSASDATVWLNELNIISSHGYNCIALDLRGHGETRLMIQPKEHIKIDVESHVHDVYQTLEEIGIIEDGKAKKKITIVTHSFGGIVAVNVAERYPDLVEKLILVAMPPQLVSPMKDFLKVLLGKPLEIIQKNLDLIQNSPLRARYKSSIMTNAHVLQEIYKHVRKWNAYRKVSKLKCKIYFAAGRFDMVAPAPLIFRLSELTIGSTFELFKWSGHALMEDEPEKFQTWLLNSVKEDVSQHNDNKQIKAQL